MSSINLPGVTIVPVATQPELLATTEFVIQASGILKSGEGEAEVGAPIAWDSGTEKFILFDADGGGDGATCVGFARIPGDSTDGDVAIEVVLAGGVKYSLVSADPEWDASILADLGARYIVIMDMLWF